MDTNKQTAVEWLVDNLTSHYPHIKELKLTIGLAKDMEKEQIMMAVKDSWYMAKGSNFQEPQEEQYYTQTYVSNRDNQTL